MLKGDGGPIVAQKRKREREREEGRERVMVGLRREKGVLERISDGWFLVGKRKGVELLLTLWWEGR